MCLWLCWKWKRDAIEVPAIKFKIIIKCYSYDGICEVFASNSDAPLGALGATGFFWRGFRYEGSLGNARGRCGRLCRLLLLLRGGGVFWLWWLLLLLRWDGLLRRHLRQPNLSLEQIQGTLRAVRIEW